MFKAKKEILEKLVPPYYRDIPKTQKYHAELLETLKKETWAEENTRLCDPTLWKQSRLARLPADIAQRIYQKIFPLSSALVLLFPGS